MPPNMQQQPGSQQQPAAQIQPGQVPTQFAGYVNPTEHQQHTGNSTPFININQRMGMPHLDQPYDQVPTGAAQAGPHHSCSKQQYMYHPSQYTGQMGYYNQTNWLIIILISHEYIQSGGGYVYAQNPGAVNMYRQSGKHFVHLFVLNKD